MVTFSWLHDPLIHLFSALGLALLLGLGGQGKLRDRQGFALVLEGYGQALGQWLPAALRGVLLLLLPALELLAAVGLLCSPWLGWSAIPAALLLGGYALVLAASLGRVEDCGCHLGARRQPPAAALVWRNLLLVLMAFNLLLPMTDRPLQWLDALTLGLALMAGVAIYQLAHVLISNHALLKEL